MTTITAVFLAGALTGLILAVAIGYWLGRRKRSHVRLFAAFQLAVFDVQDAVAMGLSDDTCNNLRTIRDQALAAYLAALGE